MKNLRASHLSSSCKSHPLVTSQRKLIIAETFGPTISVSNSILFQFPYCLLFFLCFKFIWKECIFFRTIRGCRHSKSNVRHLLLSSASSSTVRITSFSSLIVASRYPLWVSSIDNLVRAEIASDVSFFIQTDPETITN